MLTNKIKALRGPILVLGAGGFVGANLFHRLLQSRNDVYGTYNHSRSRLLTLSNTIKADLMHDAHFVMDYVKPATIFDLITYGGYLNENDTARIYETNVMLKTHLLELVLECGTHCYIHAGSSSEYGDIADSPLEESMLSPNSHYAVAKGTSASLLHFLGKHRGLRCANLRLYSVYGPLESVATRIIPQIVLAGMRGTYPPLVRADISRDFVHVSDVCDAFVDAALSLSPDVYGQSFNVGSGIATTIGELAAISKDIFNIDADPIFSTMEKRAWDFNGKWMAQTDKTRERLGWKSIISVRDGLQTLADWYKGGGA
jgi:dolichol-phosphate mannosyltransferase